MKIISEAKEEREERGTATHILIIHRERLQNGYRIAKQIIDNSPWSYNTDNELTGFGATSMTYDSNGNMTADSSAGSTLSYDFENRLATFVTGSVSASYLYDPQGRRLQKTVNGVATRYLWDGATMIAELDGTNQVQRIYTYNPQTMDPVSTAIGCTAYFYITDHLMTPQMLTSMSGTTAWYAELSSFGTANVITSTVTNNLRFPGQYADAESGLYYNYARYYMPQSGRYAETDKLDIPIVIAYKKAVQAQIALIDDTPVSYDDDKILAHFFIIMSFKKYSSMGLAYGLSDGLLPILNKSSLTNEQAFDLYLYTQNNPIRNIDINGLGCSPGPWWFCIGACELICEGTTGELIGPFSLPFCIVSCEAICKDTKKKCGCE